MGAPLTEVIGARFVLGRLSGVAVESGGDLGIHLRRLGDLRQTGLGVLLLSGVQRKPFLDLEIKS